MDELIKAFAYDARTIGEHRSKLAPFSNMEIGLYGKETMAKVALGRVLLVRGGKDCTNTGHAMDVAQDYLNGEH